MESARSLPPSRATPPAVWTYLSALPLEFENWNEDTTTQLYEQNSLLSSTPCNSFHLHRSTNRLESELAFPPTMARQEGGNSVNYTDPNFEFELKRRNVFPTQGFPYDWDFMKESIDRPGPETELTNRYSRAREILQNAPNESMVTCEVTPVLVPMGTLFLSDDFDAVSDAQWRVSPLPKTGQTESGQRLTSPKPDITIGFKLKHRDMPLCVTALDQLPEATMPVICRPELICPCFTVESKGLESTHFASLQNMHNSAYMIRNLETLRSSSNSPNWQAEFYDRILTLTASVTKDKISVHGHWASRENGETHFYNRPMKTWTSEHEDFQEIHLWISRAIFTLLERNRKWIMEDLINISSKRQIAASLLSAPSLSAPPTPRKRKRTSLEANSFVL